MSESTPSVKQPGEKDDGLSKYMRRMKTVLKGTRSNRGSVSSLGEILGETSKSGAATTKKTTATTPAPAAAAAPSSSLAPKSAAAMTADAPKILKYSSLQEDKARVLFAKYGLTLEPGEWITGPTSDREVQRVEKPIRMRVRRNCHRCLTTFGADKACPKCQHSRCQKCFRYPPSKSSRKDLPEKKAKDSVHLHVPSQAHAHAHGATDAKKTQPREKIVLTLPSRTGGQDLVKKAVRQRVRRNCHVCSTLFVGEATECLQCKHIRCKKCPRDPPKLSKYPDGYPGDVEPPFEPQERVWRKPRRRIRWTCESCSTMFPNGEKVCGKCQHERCGTCIRDPPKKIKPEPDPELLRRVEEKLARVTI